MIAYLKGKILERTAETVTLVVNDSLGYAVYLPEDDLRQLKIGHDLELYCYHHISDRGQDLYGFQSADRRYFFRLLIDHVPGIGPKSALKIIGKIRLGELESAIREGNVAKLVAMGLGKKTADKLIVSLQDRLLNGEAAPDRPSRSPHYDDACMALVNLGYKKSEAEAALAQIDFIDKSVEEIIRETLKNF